MPEPSPPHVQPSEPAAAAEILVLVAHPAQEQSRVNRELMRAAEALGPRVEVRDLYALYPDYLIDVAAEQAKAAAASLIVWQHPVHWYGMTPLMKLWLDEVLAFGWAYGKGDGDAAALQGKQLWLVASTGGTDDSYHPASYNRYFFDAFLPPYEQTAALCGMRFLAPLLLHGAHRASAAEVAAHAAVYADRLASYPAWPELADAEPCIVCELPDDVRPSADEEAEPHPDPAVDADPAVERKAA